MKQIFTILTFNLIMNLSFGQALKTYNGQFSDGRLVNGTAVYTYYEDPSTHEYMKQGTFKYTFNGKGDYLGLNQTITGNFDKGLKNGLWTYSITLADFNIENGLIWLSDNNVESTGTISLTANYKNGYADGAWKQTRSYKKRSKIYYYGSYKWGPFSPLKSLMISMNFKNNYVIGAININDEFANFKASGNCDNNSLCTGTWLINDVGWNNNKELIYKDNFLYEFVSRDNNGKVNANIKYEDNYNSLIKAKSMTQAERDEAGLKIDSFCNATSNIKEYFPKLFNVEYFLYEQIGGDLSFKEGFKGGCELDVSQTKYNALLENENYKKAEDYYTKNDYLQAYYLYSSIDLKKIKPSERLKVESRISEITPLLESLKKAASDKKNAEEQAKADKKKAEEQVAAEKASEIRKITEKLTTETNNFTSKNTEFIAMVSEQKDKIVLKPKNYIKLEEYSEYSSIFNKNLTYYRGQILKKGYINIYNAYTLLIVNCTKSDSLLIGIKLIEKQIEITDTFITICKSEEYKSFDKQLKDIIDIDEIKKIVNLN